MTVLDLRQREPPDLRLAPAAAAGWLVAWLVPVIGYAGGFLLAGGCAAGGAAALAAYRQRAGAAGPVVHPRPAAAVGVAAVLFAAGGIAAGSAARVAAVMDGPIADLAAARRLARVQLVVTGDAEPIRGGAVTPRRDPYLAVPARLERVDDLVVRLPVVVLADGREWAQLVPSERVRAVGRLSSPRRVDGTAAVISARGDPMLIGGPSGLQRTAADLRGGLRGAVSVLPAAERGLVPGVTVGDTSAMPAELAEQFRRAGLTHLTAVSGANLAIVVAVVLLAGRWMGLRGRVTPVVALVAMVGFVVLARPEPSVVRAAAMATFAVAALLTGRQRAGTSVLCGTVLVLLLIDPWLARSYGFALSVLATGALLLLAPAWRDRLANWIARRVGREPPGRLALVVAEAIAIPAAAQVACLPVLVMLSGEISVVAVVANLLAVPAVAPVTVLGLLALVVAPISGRVAELIAHVAGVPAGWIVRVARTCAELPGAVIPWRPGALGAATVLLVVGIGVVVVPYVVRRPALALAGSCILAAVLVRPVVSLGWPPAGWLMVACDVGQGDGLVLRAATGTAVVVDAGPEPDLMDRCLRDLGVRRVPVLVLTHFHADHVRGLPGVIEGRQVDEIIVSPLADPPEGAEQVAAWAVAAKIPVRTAVDGQRLAVGDIALEVLGPDRLVGAGAGSAANNASVVVRVATGGLDVLLTGDIEPPAQSMLLSSGDDVGADVLKVPHHGSAYQDPRLLSSVRPAIALISVGADNDYGHPAPGTLTMLRMAGVVVARTDEDGDVAIVSDDGEPRVVVRR